MTKQIHTQRHINTYLQSCIHRHICTHTHTHSVSEVLTTPHCLYLRGTIQMTSTRKSFIMASLSPKEHLSFKQEESIPVAQALCVGTWFLDRLQPPRHLLHIFHGDIILLERPIESTLLIDCNFSPLLLSYLWKIIQSNALFSSTLHHFLSIASH